MKRAARLILIVAGTAASLWLAPAPASAAVDEAKARAFIQNIADRAVNAIQANITKQERSERLRQILRDGFDITTFGNFALGRYRRQASPEQIKEYLAAFESYVVYTYSDRLGKFADGNVRVTGTRQAGTSSSDIFVLSQVQGNGKEPVPVEWRVREEHGKLRIIDVGIEGTSQILAYRDEFAAVIHRRGNGIDGLIAELREKNAQLQARLTSGN